MSFLVLCFTTSLVVTFLVIRSGEKHFHVSADHDISGPQKFHSEPVPRIGGVAVFIAVLAGAFMAVYTGQRYATDIWLLLAASLPTFGFGLAEDLTKGVSPRRRLFFTGVSAALGVWLLDAVIRRTAIPGIDHLIVLAPFAMALTVFAVTGVANAVNIIDGFNGLAAMCVLMMLLAIAYVAFQVGDEFILTAALISIGAVLGFFIWNFPAGLIFLGDGGAYFLGFLLAELSVLLLRRNAQVSPMFPLLLCAYPIFETVFSIYRKKILRGSSPGQPDGVHLHMLVYKRLMRWGQSPRDRRKTTRNSMTSPYLWLLCLLSVIPAVLWWRNTALLTAFLILFMLSYVLLYWSIVRFRTPRWLVFRR
ncbi:MAG TPA: glycosyltransferase [Caldimonas sp.]|jgi:UDP-N-acetylmuramyl pentapeptide phosphotransferase/UDP-N-acetylglucosamine-1-phosphate transferase|nr:glycosyltransferase [Caldimonas sp.]